jgi:hypothetical protein
LDWPRCNLPVEPSLCLKRSPFPGRDCDARANSAKTGRCPSLVSAETGTRTAEPANSGPFGSRQEISESARVRGGPERWGIGLVAAVSGPLGGCASVIMHRMWVDGTEFRWTREEAAAA